MKQPSARSTVRTALAPAGWVMRTAVSSGAARLLPPPRLGRIDGRMVDLPGRGRTFVLDVAGPSPDAPTVVLLHALGCTGHLSWALAIEEISRTHRVVTLDQRWHGRGIRSPRFRFTECADDVAAVMDVLDLDRAVVAGYSMGGAVAQLVWHRHPERVAGLVLCSTARNFRGLRREQLFFPVVSTLTRALDGHALSRVERLAASLPELPDLDRSDAAAWGRTEFRSTSAWSFPAVLSEVGRFNSADWIGDVDVPTAVVVTARDRTIPARRQHRLASVIPGATTHVAPGGHASLVLGAKAWVPRFREALHEVTERARFDVAEEPRAAVAL